MRSTISAKIVRDVLGHVIIDDFRGKYFFLSNFYLRTFTMYGIVFDCSERAYMWHKTDLQTEKDAIMAVKTPADVKEQGGPGFTTKKPGWDEIHRQPSMFSVRDAQYTQNPDLKQRLLNTEDSLLIEGNWWHDNFWGDCNCPKCICIPGENYLGKTHMSLREKYKNEVAATN
jgi:ribA/ribD-fused uncharacterized protein